MSRKLGLVGLSLILCFCVGCSVNPITGQEEFMLFPENKDIEIGRKYAPEVEKQMGGKIENESLQRYIDNVGQKIARVCHRPDLEYHFTALDHESLNALALPGGYVFITRGMLEKLTTEAQLAGILGHEVTHVIARDSSAAMSREIGIGILLSAAASADAPGGVLSAADVTRQILGLHYSRRDEQEADLDGLDYMVQAGYNPHGMIETMQILQNEQKVRPIEFFSTHPNPRNRKDYLTQRIQSRHSDRAGLKIGADDYRRSVLEHLIDDKAD